MLFVLSTNSNIPADLCGTVFLLHSDVNYGRLYGMYV